jgi:hypothetical protein
MDSVLWISCFQCSKSPSMNPILFENNLPFYPMDFILSMLQITTYVSYMIWKQCSILYYGFMHSKLQITTYESYIIWKNVPFYPMDFMLSMLQITTYESYIIWKQCSILSYGFYAFNAPNHHLWILYYLKTMFHFVPYLLAFAPSFLGSWARVRKIGGCSVWQLYRWGVGCGNIE